MGLYTGSDESINYKTNLMLLMMIMTLLMMLERTKMLLLVMKRIIIVMRSMMKQISNSDYVDDIYDICMSTSVMMLLITS
ncbi:hypothetical protein DPMN_036607 [Dreissena polymorpha]|uniref:Uncharacterized protein n=1 Tax=Dreissena polymorpha TaxID=45954 RepID=A0A9D4RN96_DREPO|nr:hypothetical protein DPMN_036607 [Dreissena polymorpha]